jgi:hypothetical protein
MKNLTLKSGMEFDIVEVVRPVEEEILMVWSYEIIQTPICPTQASLNLWKDFSVSGERPMSV